MKLLRAFLGNHVLATLAFALVLAVGFITYGKMPRAQDPEINFNWISITTALPGASAEDVEKLVTLPLEDAIRKVSDIKFVSSNSREGVSSMLVRFRDISSSVFDKRVNDLRREVQNKANAELPPEAEDPVIFEITSSNGFPTAMVVVAGREDDELLRRSAKTVKDDIERLEGVDTVLAFGLHDPELVVEFRPDALQAHGLSPARIADAVRAWFRDTFGGKVRVAETEWLVRLTGKHPDPEWLAGIPIRTGERDGYAPLSALAEVSRLRAKPEQIARLNGRPAVMLSVNKKSYAHNLALVGRLNDYIERKNPLLAASGVEIVLVDDQTVPTREALGVMENNAALGLLLVLGVCWVFLGSRIALLVALGIPFALAGTFWILYSMGFTLNTSVLLGVVIVLGMLVDDAVVVVEAIYYRLTRGIDSVQATFESLREVIAPVTSAVLTTMAAFVPLMLLPGIVGKFMFVIPMVVTTALAFSLLEAYWFLPAHLMALRINFTKSSPAQRHRVRYTHWIRVKYARFLLYVMRRTKRFLALAITLFALAVGAVLGGLVHIEFFAFDPLRLFHVNIDAPPGTALDETLRRTLAIEAKVHRHLKPGEARAVTAMAGIKFTETEPFQGDHFGQVVVSLNPKREGMREVDEVIEAMREDVLNGNGDTKAGFLRLSGGPPLLKPINIKVRGDDYRELRAAADRLEALLRGIPEVSDISDDDSAGRRELELKLDGEALQRAGLDAAEVARIVRLMIDGEVVASMQHLGEEVEVRVRAKPGASGDVTRVLALPVALPGGGHVLLGALVKHETGAGKGTIRHYNFRRTITVEANLDKSRLDTVAANRIVRDEWAKVRADYPGVDLDFSGELEDIQESLDAMALLFLFGVGLMYLILGTQFKSYWQPLLILVTVPLAFTGVVLGLLVTRNPLSLFTMYGVIALTGIAVNSAIVLIDAANDRLKSGMSVLHATVYAGRRRVVPILITSFTTIAGLFSLATGLGGHSLVWGPVASSIVWGLGFATILTLFVIPLLYRMTMARSRKVHVGRAE